MIKFISFCGALISLISSLYGCTNLRKDGAYVFNVGHGNLAVVKSGNDCVVIDCGTSNRHPEMPQDCDESGLDYVLEYVVPAAANVVAGCSGNRYIVISHRHSDHISLLGFLAKIVRTLDENRCSAQQPEAVRRPINKIIFSSTSEQKVMSQLRNVSIDLPKETCNRIAPSNFLPDIRVGNNPGITIKLRHAGGKSGNADNLAVRVETSGKRYLFLGDAGFSNGNNNQPAESYSLITLSSDINNGTEEEISQDMFPDPSDSEMEEEEADSSENGTQTGTGEVLSPIKGEPLDDDFLSELNLCVAPHHGSNANNELAFFKFYSRKGYTLPITIISGRYGSYGTPSSHYKEIFGIESEENGNHVIQFSSDETLYKTSKPLYTTHNLRDWPRDVDSDALYVGYRVDSNH